MPHARNGKIQLYWKQDGADDRPALLLLHSVLTSHDAWDRLVPFLTDHYRVIRMDLRGHGASSAISGDYTLTELASDAWAVLDAAEVDRAILCGVSLGGLIAMQMACDRPVRVDGLVMANCSLDPDRQLWQDRIAEAQQNGVSGLVAKAMERWFGTDERRDMRRWVDPLRRSMLGTSIEGYCGCAATMCAFEIEQVMGQVQVPTLVIASTGDGESASSPSASSVSQLIPDAVERRIPGGHYAFVDNPGAFASALDGGPSGGFTGSVSPATNGERTRRAVLGDAFVDASNAKRDKWIADYRDYVNDVVWHTVWSRHGLDYRTRRLLVIAMTAVLGRWEEYRLHVRSGIKRQSLTVQDIKEVSLQAGLYGGVPAANTAFAECSKLFDEMGLAADDF